MQPIRLALVDDHRMFREALRIALGEMSDLHLVGEAATGREALALVEQHAPDVVVLDIALPDIGGIALAGMLRERLPALRLVALSGYADREFVEGMMAAGASGYVVKSAGADELVAAVRAASSGGTYFSADALAALLPRARGGAGALPSELTAREQGVLRALASGLRSAEIARQLGISAATVEVHRRNIRDKLGLRNVAELVRYAMKEGLVDD